MRSPLPLLRNRWLVLLCLGLLINKPILSEQIEKENTKGITLDNNDNVDDLIPSFTEEQLQKLDDSKEKFAFKTEVSRVMNIIIHSLYKDKEIFLRELISNASDALDKYRLLTLSQSDSSSKSKDTLQLKIKADKASRTLTILDTGIGMTSEELKKNLGTIAKSGTADFLKKLEASKESNNLIGQFGVGFYSAFLVADKVVVTSRALGHDQYIWESKADADFTIAKDPRGNTLEHGTMITLYLKKEDEKFLESKYLEELIQRYSEYIEFPIYLWKKSKTFEEVPDEEDKDKTKRITKEHEGYIQMNIEPPIWTKDPKKVTEEEHLRLFQKLNDHLGQPLSQIHFSAEGQASFRSILYVPKLGFESLKLPKVIDTPIKLHVKRVFITDNTVQLLPEWLGFLRGVVDCDDIPLNVSRETVQNSKIIRIIKNKLLAKAFELFNQISEDPKLYSKFLDDFEAHLKRGIRDDTRNRDRIAALLRFRSSHHKLTSLDDYIKRMKPDQKKIYFITGGSMEALLRSPYAEKLVAQGYEVLYMDQPVDEYTMQHLRTYKKLDLVHAIAAQAEIQEDKTKLEALQEEFKPLIDWFTKVLGDQVESVNLSTRLIYSPTAITPSTLGGLSGNQERLLKAQAFVTKQETEMNKWLNAKKGLEINPKHPIILKLLETVNEDKMDKSTEDTVHLLFQTSMLRSDYDLPSPQAYADRVEVLVRRQLDLSAELDYPDLKEPISNEKENEKEHKEEEEEEHEELEGESDEL